MQESSKIVQILPHLEGPTYEAYFVYAEEMRNSKRIAVFRDFLVRAPSLFFALGERIGGIAHVASFWRYCFPTPSRAVTLETLPPPRIAMLPA